MINTQTQIDSLIDLAVLQRTELKQLVDSLPQLRDHLSSEIERNLEEIEPAIRSELEQFVAARALDTQAKTSAELTAKLDAMARNLESTTAAKYSVLMAERAQNATLLAQAEARIAEAASALPGAVKGIVTDELSRFPRAGEIDQLRKEFAEPRGLNPRGRWQVGETYNKLDLVSYNGDSYVSNTDGNREKPSRSSEAWTLSAARGNGGAGGGVTSLTDLVAVPANGELLIGNGSAFVNNTITGGTGVTVTNGPGTITIDASGAQEILTATVTNAESVAITRGQVVYLFGATGNRASVKLANNATDAESSKTFGVVSEASIAAGANGLVTCVGTVDKLALGSYTEGDVLYLGATPGSVTATKPYAPNHLVYVGIVERANNGNGELYVRIQNGFELDEIHDVQITTPPLAGSLLMRDATNSLWKANRLTGTANQVTVTNADTSVTLSLPTTIANVNSVTAATAQNLTLAGGSTGASLVLGQGANAGTTLALKGTGRAKTQVGTDYNLRTFLSGTTVQIDGANDAENSYRNVSIQALKLSLLDSSGGNVLIGGTTDIAGSGGLKVFGTTAASSTTSGALQVAGGVGVAGAGYFGGTGTFGSSFGKVIINQWSDATNYGAITLNGNTTVAGSLGIGGGASGDSTLYLNAPTGGKIESRINGTAALTIASTGAATFAGAVTVSGTGIQVNAAGFGSAPNSYYAISSAQTLSGNGNQAFLNVSPTFNADAAGGQGNVLWVQGKTAASYTLAALAGLKVESPSIGAGGAVTTVYGLRIQDQTGGSTNYAIATGAGRVSFGDTTPSTGAGSGALQVAGGIYSGAASVFAGQLTAKGTATNDSAATGYIGEYLSSALASGSAVSLTTGTLTNITSVSLTAGDWDVSGVIALDTATATVSTIQGSPSTTSATLGALGAYLSTNLNITLASQSEALALPVSRISISGTTTVYLVGRAYFSAGTVAGYGMIRARRVR